MPTTKPRKLITFSEEDVRRLAALAKKLELSEAAVVRKALRALARANDLS